MSADRFDYLPASVTLAEIDAQRANGWPDFHPEHFCHRCGGRNVSSWWVDSDLFNAAFGPSQHPYNGIVCPGCFADAHEQATGRTTTWMLVPDPTIRFIPAHPPRWWADENAGRSSAPAMHVEAGQ